MRMRFVIFVRSKETDENVLIIVQNVTLLQNLAAWDLWYVGQLYSCIYIYEVFSPANYIVFSPANASMKFCVELVFYAILNHFKMAQILLLHRKTLNLHENLWGCLRERIFVSIYNLMESFPIWESLTLQSAVLVYNIINSLLTHCKWVKKSCLQHYKRVPEMSSIPILELEADS